MNLKSNVDDLLARFVNEKKNCFCVASDKQTFGEKTGMVSESRTDQAAITTESVFDYANDVLFCWRSVIYGISRPISASPVWLIAFWLTILSQASTVRPQPLITRPPTLETTDDIDHYLRQ